MSAFHACMTSSATLRSADASPPLPRTLSPTWSRDLAYATGLIATDGYLTAQTSVGFGSTDKELVETFLHCVDRPVRYSTVPAGPPGNIRGDHLESEPDYDMAVFR